MQTEHNIFLDQDAGSIADNAIADRIAHKDSMSITRDVSACGPSEDRVLIPNLIFNPKISITDAQRLYMARAYAIGIDVYLSRIPEAWRREAAHLGFRQIEAAYKASKISTSTLSIVAEQFMESMRSLLKDGRAHALKGMQRPTSATFELGSIEPFLP